MYKRELVVMPSDASCNGELKLRSLLDYFQDTAALAVNDIEGTSTELASRGYAWILRNYEIEFVGKLPSLDEEFFIHTAHDPKHGFNCLRIFRVFDAHENLIVDAKSSWLLFDLTAQRPVKPSVHLPEILTRDNIDVEPDFQAIDQIMNHDHDLEIERKVAFHDLDVNSHVNNAAYFEWIFESTPLDLMTCSPKHINASFRSGIRWGDKVRINIARLDDKNFAYNIMNLSHVDDKVHKKPSAEFFCEWHLPGRSD